jgi:hypothetical protein
MLLDFCVYVGKEIAPKNDFKELCNCPQRWVSCNIAAFLPSVKCVKYFMENKIYHTNTDCYEKQN